MTKEIRDAYDLMASQYASFALGDLDRVPGDREWLAAFAEIATLCAGPVVDVGCGPGHIVNHLAELGLSAVGYDISMGLISEARRAFPELPFQVGDLSLLGVADSSLGGIVARYSLIHMSAEYLPDVFGEWLRVLEPGAPILVSFFASSSAVAHGSSFDHAVATAYELFPRTVVSELEEAGFGGVEVSARDPLEGERPLKHATILARKSRV